MPLNPLRSLLVVACLGSGLAWGADCPGTQIEFLGERWTAELQKHLREELEVEIRRDDLCATVDGVAVAHLGYVWTGAEPVGVSVAFSRNGVERLLRRRINPAGIPQDGLALALAAVGGELLAEVQRVLRPEPVEVAAPLASASAPAPVPDLLLSARGAGEAWTGQEVLWGADVGVRLLLQSLELEATVGERTALLRDVPAGLVRVQGASAGVSAALGLLVESPWRLNAEVGATGGALWERGAPQPGWSGTSRMGWVVTARAGFELSRRSGPVSVFLRGGVDVPLRGLAATNGSQTLEAVSGVGGYAALGVGWLR